MATTEPGWACAQTVYRLFQSMDDGRFDDAAALFADEAVWIKRGEAIRGRDAIRASMAARPAAVTARHLVTNLVIDADAEGAAARYYVTTFADEAWSGSGPGALALPMLILVCEDRLVERAEGWRFAARSSRVAFARS